MKFQCSIRFPGMSPIRNISYLLYMCWGFSEKCINSQKTDQGCSTPLNWWNQNYLGAPTTRSGGGERKFTYVRYDEPPKLVDISHNTHTHPPTHTHTPTHLPHTKQLQGAPSLNCSSYDYTFKKCPFPTLFS